MRELEVRLTKGLPASGKTTYAKKLVAGDESNSQIKGSRWVNVNKDDLRAMLHNGKYTKGNENQVLRIRDAIILEALQSGRNVVVSDTNLDSVHEHHIAELVKDMAHVKVTVEDKFLQVPVDECIRRDLNRPASVGKDVIMRMYNRYLRPAFKPALKNPRLEDVYLFILDANPTAELLELCVRFQRNRSREYGVVVVGEYGSQKNTVESVQALVDKDVLPNYNIACVFTEREDYQKHFESQGYSVAKITSIPRFQLTHEGIK